MWRIHWRHKGGVNVVLLPGVTEQTVFAITIHLPNFVSSKAAAL